jgi:hypothetical protein
MPAAPKTALKAASETHYVTWDEFVEEATKDIEPFAMVLPGDDEPTTFPCPTGDQMQAFGEAGRSMDDAAAAVALFGDELAPRILTLTGAQPFTVRAKLFQRIMAHYGMQMGDLPESSASSQS